jgi:hypothetical protein
MTFKNKRAAMTWSRSMSRRINRAIDNIMRGESGDHCSICRTQFANNSRTYGGVTDDGTVALVGECCASRLQWLHTSGIYLSRPYEKTPKVASPSHPGFSLEEINAAIAGWQEYYTEEDKLSAAMVKRAGISQQAVIHRAPSASKTDDANWFAANPTRSHRLRPPFPNETFGDKPLPDLPPGHEICVAIRQIEPGTRVKFAFARNTKVPMPDDESSIHAFFDVAAKGGGDYGTVAELAAKYAAAGKS